MGAVRGLWGVRPTLLLTHCPHSRPRSAAGRRLTWQTALGTADLKASFGGGARRPEISCSTYQMAVLMLFNDAELLTYEEVGAACGITPEEDLKRVLQSLACVKVRLVGAVGGGLRGWGGVGWGGCKVGGSGVKSLASSPGILHSSTQTHAPPPHRPHTAACTDRGGDRAHHEEPAAAGPQ